MSRATSDSDSPQSIANAIDELRQELAVVRQVLDEVLDELQWANRNRRNQEDSWRVVQPLTSMPLDPIARDWAQRLNRFSAVDLPTDEPDASKAEPGRLF